jgi:hypothetical protein
MDSNETRLAFAIHGHLATEEDLPVFDKVMSEGTSLLDNWIILPEWSGISIPPQRSVAYCPACKNTALSNSNFDVRFLVSETFDRVCSIQHATFCPECNNRFYGYQSLRLLDSGDLLCRYKNTEGAWVHLLYKVGQPSLPRLICRFLKAWFLSLFTRK